MTSFKRIALSFISAALILSGCGDTPAGTETDPALGGSVTVSGTAEVGQTLMADISALEGSGTVSYQWKRGDSAEAVNVNIDNAVDSTYELQAADENKYIAVTVTRTGYSSSVTSNFAGPVAAADTEFNLADLAMDANYTLTEDIELPDNWIPLGTNEAPFTGTLDGGGKTITVKSFVANAEGGYYGIFGVTRGATIRNLNISVPGAITVNITEPEASGNAGIVAGTITNTKIENISVSGGGSFTVTRVVDIHQLYVGGIAGWVAGKDGDFSKISNASVSIAIRSYLTLTETPETERNSVAGGIAGRVQVDALPGSIIENSSSSGVVSATSSGEKSRAYAGGIAGRVVKNAPEILPFLPAGDNTPVLVSIDNCHSTGNINATSGSNRAFAGGITGEQENLGVIMNSWASGNITATASSGSPAGNISDALAGGIAGLNRGGSLIYQSYYKSGKVYASSGDAARAGGIAGRNESHIDIAAGNNIIISTIRECFSSGLVEANGTGRLSNAGGIVGTNLSDISDCFSTGSVLARGNVSDNPAAGGIAGGNQGKPDAVIRGTIEKSYALGEIAANSNIHGYAAGIVGGNEGITNYCVALNKKISVMPRFAARVSGRWSAGFESKGNVAYENMIVEGGRWEPLTLDDPFGPEGLGLPLADLKKPAISGTSIYEKAFTTNNPAAGLGWDFVNAWKFLDDPAYPYPVFQWMDVAPENDNPILGD